MQIKLVALLFVTAVLASFFMASILPYAHALSARTDFSNRHSSASYGNSKICGDHKCASGEQTQWGTKTSAQKTGYGKVGDTSHGVDVMHKIVGSTPAPTTMHGNVKVTEKIAAGENMTNKGNTTKGTK